MRSAREVERSARVNGAPLHRVPGLEGSCPAGGEQEGVLHHEARVGADADAGLPDESAGVQGGPGVEGGLGLRERGPADLGVVPAGNGIEVLPARLELPDDQDLVGDVEQRLVGYGAGIEAPQLLGEHASR